MAVNTGTILRVILTGYFGGDSGNPILNVFFYQVGSTTDGAFTLDGGVADNIWDAMHEQFMDDLLGNIHQAFAYDTIHVDDMTDTLHPFGDATIIDGQGQQEIGDSLPVWDAWAFRLNRTNRLTRNGAKRFCGVPESLVSNGAPISSIVSSMTSIAGNMGLPLTVTLPTTGEFEMFPIIARVSPTGLTVLASQPVASGSFSGVSTQNSRKP